MIESRCACWGCRVTGISTVTGTQMENRGYMGIDPHISSIAYQR
jgi:hypothetical protein